jgi:hypothetical protein
MLCLFVAVCSLAFRRHMITTVLLQKLMLLGVLLQEVAICAFVLDDLRSLGS